MLAAGAAMALMAWRDPRILPWLAVGVILGHAQAMTGQAVGFLTIDRPSRLRFTWSNSNWADPTVVSVVDVAFTPSGAEGVYQWRMAIDTSRCIGCNACVIACRAENNIPVVGRDQMAKGRALDWIRIDRYFTEAGALTAIPVACQQCGKAPCESVCPVNATVHTTEGLNAMVYARCWGTRYCATNCPYKARRFNFFDYAKASGEATRLQRNPNVTVRSRGVMEKCTYCVQMVERAKIRHKSRLMKEHPGQPSTSIHVTEKDLLLPDGAAQTACQLACPMGAITFGNVLDPAAAVSRAKSLPRHRSLLSSLGMDPGTGYLVPAGNPNPAMEA